MTKQRRKADLRTVKGTLEALQAAYEGRLYKAHGMRANVHLNASTGGLHIMDSIKLDRLGWFEDHDLYIEEQNND